MIGDAAKADVQVSAPPSKAIGLPTALLPVCLPDEGSSDWLDMFLKKNPQYTEISDRKILEWRNRSGQQPPSKVLMPQTDGGIAKRLLIEAAGSQGRDIV